MCVCDSSCVRGVADEDEQRAVARQCLPGLLRGYGLLASVDSGPPQPSLLATTPPGPAPVYYSLLHVPEKTPQAVKQELKRAHRWRRKYGVCGMWSGMAASLLSHVRQAVSRDSASRAPSASSVEEDGCSLEVLASVLQQGSVMWWEYGFMLVSDAPDQPSVRIIMRVEASSLDPSSATTTTTAASGGGGGDDCNSVISVDVLCSGGVSAGAALMLCCHRAVQSCLQACQHPDIRQHNAQPLIWIEEVQKYCNMALVSSMCSSPMMLVPEMGPQLGLWQTLEALRNRLAGVRGEVELNGWQGVDLQQRVAQLEALVAAAVEEEQARLRELRNGR